MSQAGLTWPFLRREIVSDRNTNAPHMRASKQVQRHAFISVDEGRRTAMQRRVREISEEGSKDHFLPRARGRNWSGPTVGYAHPSSHLSKSDERPKSCGSTVQRHRHQPWKCPAPSSSNAPLISSWWAQTSSAWLPISYLCGIRTLAMVDDKANLLDARVEGLIRQLEVADVSNSPRHAQCRAWTDTQRYGGGHHSEICSQILLT